MNQLNSSNIVAMWIVALVLVGAVGAHGMLPDTPPRLAHGVETFAPRPEFAELGLASLVVPMGERSPPALTREKSRTPNLSEFVQGITKRVLGC